MLMAKNIYDSDSDSDLVIYQSHNGKKDKKKRTKTLLNHAPRPVTPIKRENNGPRHQFSGF